MIGYSRRGYFRSDPGDPTDPGVGADDLHCLVERLGLPAVHLVGAAQGGFYVLDYVLSHPERVRSMAIVSSYMGISEADYAAVNTRLRPPFFATLPHDFQGLSPSFRAGRTRRDSRRGRRARMPRFPASASRRSSGSRSRGRGSSPSGIRRCS